LNYASEVTFTHRACAKWLVGANLILDAKTQKATAYNFGVVYEPAEKLLVGFKHESAKDLPKYSPGKYFFYFYHQASAVNTVGTEFVLDWQKKVIETKFGLTHKFDDNNTGKVKVNHNGQVDALLKHKFSDVLTAVAVTSFNAKAF
jgi:hypothetical protein